MTTETIVKEYKKKLDKQKRLLQGWKDERDYFQRLYGSKSHQVIWLKKHIDEGNKIYWKMKQEYDKLRSGQAVADL